jgi:hypothetical protein
MQTSMREASQANEDRNPRACGAALIRPGLINVLAYKLKGPWSNSEIDTAGTVVRWGAVGAAIMLVAMDMLT